MGPQFSQKFEVLGVTLDVGEVLDRGRAVVDNSEKRKQVVVDQIAAILRSGTLSSAEAEQLCGRLGFAASQLFVRIGSAAIWHLRRKDDLHEGPAPLTGPPATSLEDWAKAVVSQAPRSIFFEPRGQVVVCCFDGFLDGEGSTLRAGVGAIIADREMGTFEAFGVMLPPTVLRKLCAAAGSERVIAEVELLAVLAAKKFWRAHLGKWAGRRVAFYVDNEGARYGLIKGYSPNRLCAWAESRVESDELLSARDAALTSSDRVAAELERSLVKSATLSEALVKDRQEVTALREAADAHAMRHQALSSRYAQVTDELDRLRAEHSVACSDREEMRASLDTLKQEEADRLSQSPGPQPLSVSDVLITVIFEGISAPVLVRPWDTNFDEVAREWLSENKKTAGLKDSLAAYLKHLEETSDAFPVRKETSLLEAPGLAAFFAPVGSMWFPDPLLVRAGRCPPLPFGSPAPVETADAMAEAGQPVGGRKRTTRKISPAAGETDQGV